MYFNLIIDNCDSVNSSFLLDKMLAGASKTIKRSGFGKISKKNFIKNWNDLILYLFLSIKRSWKYLSLITSPEEILEIKIFLKYPNKKIINKYKIFIKEIKKLYSLLKCGFLKSTFLFWKVFSGTQWKVFTDLNKPMNFFS